MVNRRKEEPKNTDGKGRIKFRYTDSERTLDFSMENVTGDSVAEGLRSIATALAGRVVTMNPGRTLPKPKNAPATMLEDEEEQVEIVENEAAEITDLEDEDEPADNETGADKARRPRKFRSPVFLNSLNLTEANVPLAEFMKQKNPASMMDKYAVVAVWLKEHFQLTEISIDHIFTAFKHLGMESKLPNDVEKPLRNLTYNRHWFEKGAAKSTFAIVWLGESEVSKMGAGATD